MLSNDNFVPNDWAGGDNRNVTGLSGSVEVYRIDLGKIFDRAEDYENTDLFEPIGSAIQNSLAGNLEFGGSLDLSADGTILIIGSSIDCMFQSVRYDPSIDDWVRLGEELSCSTQTPEEDVGSVIMSSVALSDDGLIAAIGTPSRPEGGTRGKTEIYQFEGSLETGHWQQLGQTLEAGENGDAFGASLALSANGTIIAVGAPYNNAGRGPISGTDVTLNANVGATILYRYNEITQEWQRLGRPLTGENVGDLFGTSVSLNADGSVVAVGASLNNDNRVFLYNERVMDWVQVGEDIAGTFAFALSGSGVALSAALDVVVVGSPNNIAVNSDLKGSVQVFESGIMPKSGVVSVSVVLTFRYGDNMSWLVERLDVLHNITVIYEGVPEDTYNDNEVPEDDPYFRTATTTVNLDEGGVYRFLVIDPSGNGFSCSRFSCNEQLYGGYQLFFGEDTDDLDKLIVYGNGSFVEDADYAEYSFLVPRPNTTVSQVEMHSLTLSLTFDEYPEDVHWVIVSSRIVSGEGGSQVDRHVVAFGPETQYIHELAGTTLDVSVSVPVASAFESHFQFIFTDTARDGLCCEWGQGSITLYDEQGRLLFSGTPEGVRRAVFPFSLGD